MPPTCNHIHHKSGSVEEMVQDRHVVTYTSLVGSIVAYRFVPFPLDDLEGHSPVAGLTKCNSMNICVTFCTVSTDMARHAVPRRLQSFLLMAGANKHKLFCIMAV